LEAFNIDYNTNISNEINYTKNKDYNDNNHYNNISHWILDSGTTVHITHQLNIIENWKPHKENIIFENGEKLSSTYIGDFLGYINNYKIILLILDFFFEFRYKKYII